MSSKQRLTVDSCQNPPSINRPRSPVGVHEWIASLPPPYKDLHRATESNRLRTEKESCALNSSYRANNTFLEPKRVIQQDGESQNQTVNSYYLFAIT